MYNMVIVYGKGESPYIEPFRPSVWDDTIRTGNPWPEMAQIVYRRSVSYRILPGIRPEPVGGGLSCTNRTDGLLEKRMSPALLAGCGVVQRGVL